MTYRFETQTYHHGLRRSPSVYVPWSSHGEISVEFCCVSGGWKIPKVPVYLIPKQHGSCGKPMFLPNVFSWFYSDFIPFTRTRTRAIPNFIFHSKMVPMTQIFQHRATSCGCHVPIRSNPHTSVARRGSSVLHSPSEATFAVHQFSLTLVMFSAKSMI